MLDVLDGDVLPAWAADSQKRQATAIVFLDATGDQPLETLRLPAAYCVAYQEQFVSGDAQGGAYQCHLKLSDPSGWTIAPGGPVSAFVAPAVRTHGEPVAAASGLRDMAIGGAVGAAQVAVQAHGKEPVLPLAANVLPANWKGKKDLPSWTEEHKAARWAEYQRDHATDPKAYAQQRWDDSYETGRNNNIIGLAREREYAKAMGAVSAEKATASGGSAYVGPCVAGACTRGSPRPSLHAPPTRPTGCAAPRTACSISPNLRRLVSDITYLPLANGDWAYLCAYQDMVSKQVMGWHVMATLPEELLTTALQRAFWAQLPTLGLLVHSDRGGQYCANGYRKLLHDHQALRSQSRRGDCYDNTQAESLWSRLKTKVLELRERPVFADLADA